MAAKTTNKVDISDNGPCRKKIAITIPAAVVDESLGTTIDTLTQQAELPGFRRGRAPRRLVEKRFGSAIVKQAKEQLIQSSLSEAVTESKLRVLGNAFGQEIDQMVLEAGKDFKFEVDIEVLPTFDLPEFGGIKIRKPLISVTDQLVDDEVKKLAIQEGTLEERQSAEPGDYLTGLATMRGPDGTVHFQSDGIVVQVPPADKAPKGMIVGLVVDDLSTHMGTPKPGDKIVVKTVGPENHENEKIRGVKLEIEYTPSRCDRILPAQVNELVARFGMENEKALRDVLKERMEQRVKIDQQVAMRSQLAKFLLEQTKMDLPVRVTSQQIQRNMQRERMELMYRGVDALRIEENMALIRNKSTSDAVRDLKLFFIVDKVAEAMNIQVSDQEINGRIAQMAIERGQRPEVLRQQLIQNQGVNQVFQQIREHKTMDAILEKASIEELGLEEYNKQIKAENESGTKKA